jgi:hypothetical protein
VYHLSSHKGNNSNKNSLILESNQDCATGLLDIISISHILQGKSKNISSYSKEYEKSIKGLRDAVLTMSTSPPAQHQ